MFAAAREDYRPVAAARRKQLDLSPSVRPDMCQARGVHTLPLLPCCSTVLQGEVQMSSLTWSIIHEAAVTSVPIKRPSALDYT